MKKINFFAIILLLIITAAEAKAVVLNNFYMDVQVLNPLVPSTNRVDLCPGGVLQLKNISTYGNNWPASNTLTGTYKISFSGSWGVYPPSIAASTWYYNQVWSINMPSGTNSAPYNLYIQYLPGPGEMLGTNPQTQDLIYVRVIPAPTMTISPSISSCPGSPVTLSASGASTYTWMPGNLSGSSVIVSPTTTTTYTVTGTNAGGCTSTKTVTITMLPKPILSLPAQLACFGNPITFNPSVSGGGSFTYTWFIAINSSTFTALPYTSPSITLSQTNYAPYVFYSPVVNMNIVAVKLVVSNGSCSSEITSVALLQYPITYAQVQNVNVCNDPIIGSPDAVFSVVAPNAFGFTWQYKSPSMLAWANCSTQPAWFSNFNTNTLTVENPGLSKDGYKFQCILAGQACNNVTTNEATLGVTLCRSAQQQSGQTQNSSETIHSATVFPNPTDGNFTLRVDNPEGVLVDVIDLTGRAVITRAQYTENSIPLTLENMENGIYLVRIISKESTQTIRLIKQ